MSFFRSIWRAVVCVLLFLYATVELVVTRPRTRPERAAWLSRFCARMLRTVGLHYRTEGPVPTHGAVISNHLTFFDILLHSAIRPCVFVSKMELRKTPLLGWMSFMSGTVYVVRGGGGSAAAAGEGMAKGFRDGLPIVFFPEGTTGVGDEKAMPFRSGLIAQTLEADAPMTASFITYALSARDVAAGKTLREDVHWGKQTLLQQIWRFCALHDIDATVRFGEQPIAFSDAALANRKTAALEARNAILSISEPAEVPASPRA